MGRGGRAYDEISRSIAGASEHCVFRLNPTPGERVADVATGTGWTSRAVARCGADVVGIDIAEGMLAAARDIAREQGLAIDYQLGDAEAAAIRGRQFRRGDLDLRRHVRAGPEEGCGGTWPDLPARWSGAIAAWTPNSAAVTLRQVSAIHDAAARSPVVAVRLGFARLGRDTLGRDFRVNSEEGTVVSRFHSIEATWDAYVNGFGPVRAVAAGQQADGLQAMRQALLAWAREFTTDLGVSIPIDYLVTVGTRV